MDNEFNEDIYVKIILPNTKELLDKIYNIIYLIRKKIVRKNICNNQFITVIYKIIDNYYNKVEDEYIILKSDKENYPKYMKYYEDAKLFLSTIKNIIILLDNNYFYDDLYDTYQYFYNMITNDINSEIYSRNRKLLETLFTHLNNHINKDLVKQLNKIEINSYYYDLIYYNINNITINTDKILKFFEIKNGLIKSNITLQQNKKYNEEEIIKKKKKNLEIRKKKNNECNLELNLQEPNINKEKKNLNEIIIENTNDENELNKIKEEINQENEENEDEEDNMKNFKEELIRTFENNNNNFEYNKENRKEIKNKFDKYFDNGKLNTIKNYNNNSIASLFSHYLNNDKKLILSDNDRYSIINYKNDVREYGIDLGNLRKNFIQSLINELFEKKIFISDERENNNKYFLNSNYYPDETFFDIIKKNNKSYYDKIKNKNEDFIQDFYKFISNLITFLLFTDYNIKKEFSSYLIASFYKKSFTDYDYIYYLFKDFDKHMKSEILKIINIDNEDLNSLNLEFNNEYLLDNEEDVITSLNNSEYIAKLAKFLSIKTIDKTKDEKIITRGELINKTFTNSIPDDIKEELNNIKNINNSAISKLFSNNDLNSDEVKELFYNNLIFSILKIKDENIIHKVKTQKKIIILGNIIKSFFPNSLVELFKNKNYLKISINSKLSEDNNGKFYSILNNIEFPDYFIDKNDEEINIILNDMININTDNINDIREKYKDVIDEIEKILNSINDKIERLSGGKGGIKKQYQLYMDDKSYFIIYNNKKSYLSIDNISKKNNNLFMKIDKKYIKIIF